MSTDRDDRLAAFFNAAREDLEREDLASEEFTQRVMHRVDITRRRAMMGGAMAVIALLICAALMTGPLVTAVNVLLSVLPNSWIETGGGAVSQMFAPARSIGALVAVIFLLVLVLIRKALR